MRQCHSPNLIKLLDVFENDDLKILIIEFCDGRTLADQLKQRSDRRFSEKEAVDIIRHIINGIAVFLRGVRNCTGTASCTATSRPTT